MIWSGGSPRALNPKKENRVFLTTLTGISEIPEVSMPADSRYLMVDWMPAGPKFEMWLLARLVTSIPAKFNPARIRGSVQNVKPVRSTGQGSTMGDSRLMKVISAEDKNGAIFWN